MENKTIVFTTLAMNQTIFFVGLCKELEKIGYKPIIISFHEESCSYIEENGIEYYNIFLYNNTSSYDIKLEFEKYVDKYNISNPNLILSHEKVAFNIKSTQEIMAKYCSYFHALENIFTNIKKQAEEIVIFQELGGFSSILSTYFFALENSINNIFIEPSFFRGRIFFVKNSLKSIDIIFDGDVLLSEDLEAYLQQTLESKKIVIPSKDKRGYQNPINKILNFYNLKRLIEKLYAKIFLKKKEEFSYISNHVKRHIKMLINQLLLQNYYKEIPNEKFIYFPMHVPNDVALTVRSPEYLDQLGLIDYMLRNLPLGYKLVIKEHPAMLGDIDRKRVVKLLNMDESLILLNPSINNFDVLGKADIVLTINSKAGAEAMLNLKKTVVLGDAFYDKSPFIYKVDCLSQLHKIIDTLINQAVEIKTKEINYYFQNIWNQSYIGDLYYDSLENYQLFSLSIEKYIKENCE